MASMTTTFYCLLPPPPTAARGDAKRGGCGLATLAAKSYSPSGKPDGAFKLHGAKQLPFFQFSILLFLQVQCGKLDLSKLSRHHAQAKRTIQQPSKTT